ncbi:MAG: triose-phosphate isomerase [Flavobacteriales bacterium]|jgi:triosephosphate isomerase
MRKKIVAGNWKMNKTWPEAQALVNALMDKKNLIPAGVQVIIAPPAPYLQPLSEAAAPTLAVASQNCSQHDGGAYTGEISPGMLSSIHVNHSIIGHSERRQFYGETNEIVRAKVDACLRHGITPIFCCGELLSERNAGEHFNTVAAQVKEALFHLSAEALSKVVIAYEPVWAIGTGVTATNEQAEEMHSFIRAFLVKNYNQDVADSISILYGGSVNAANAAELFACPNVDGGLVGGASLKADDFMTIIQAAQ